MKKRILINDGWMFSLGHGEESPVPSATPEQPVHASSPENVTLPHTWNARDGQDGGNDYFRGVGRYSREITERIQPGQRLWLECEGANSVTTVWVGDQKVGRHAGGYATFRFDLTDYLTDDQRRHATGPPNDKVAQAAAPRLTVDVDNRHHEDVYPLMADFTFMGGLYRDVYLVKTEELAFDLGDHGSTGVYVTQRVHGPDRAELVIRALLRAGDGGTAERHDTGGAGKAASIQAVLRDASDAVVATHTVNDRVHGRSEVSFTLHVDKPHLWHGVEDPYLYTLHISLSEGSPVVDKVSVPVGLRAFAVNPTGGFFLNGRPYPLRGVSRHQDRRDVGWALTREHQDEDAALIGEVGATAVRLAHYQHNQYFYHLCDRLGFVVWTEIPYISVSSQTDTTGSNARAQIVELVKQNYNHPCIALWGLQNEITIAGKDTATEQIVAMLNATVKRLDPDRLTGQAQVGHHPSDDSMNRATDVVGYNTYYGWYYHEVEELDTWLTTFHREHPDIAVGITEYGCDGLPAYHSEVPSRGDYSEEYQAWFHERTLAIFARRPWLWGTFVWNMFDFASDLRDEAGVSGMNSKGLVTHDRTVRKDAFFLYKALWSTDPVLHLGSKRFRNRAAERITVVVYSNRQEVRLWVNGEAYAPDPASTTVSTVFRFPDVPLVLGENRVTAEARGPSGILTDSALFVRTTEADPSYAMPAGSARFSAHDGAGMPTWFDGDHESGEYALSFPQGFLSIKERLSTILTYPAGETALRRHLAPLFDHPMFEMAKAFTVERLATMAPDQFPPEVLQALNKELTGIPT